MRTFVAVPLPNDAIALLESFQTALRKTGAEARWTSAGSIHLTLKFLGEIESGAVPDLKDALNVVACQHARFTLLMRGLGAFPTVANPRVVWCGLEGDTDRLGALQREIEIACAGLGFPPEDRPFKPHLTLGRVKGRRNLQRLTECIRIGTPLETRISVDRFRIYRSTLRPSGAVYDVLEELALGG